MKNIEKYVKHPCVINMPPTNPPKANVFVSGNEIAPS
jgi:hypothetical protein